MTFEQITGKDGIFIDGDWVESKDQDVNGDVRLIQLADVGDGIFIDKSNRHLTSEKARDLRCTYLRQGDVLVARMPDPLGRACIFPGLSTPSVTVVDVCIVRPDPKLVISEWLVFYINNPNFRNQIKKYITGTTRQRISRGNLSKIKLSIPSIEDQKKTIRLLDKADCISQKRKQALVLLDEYLKSTFLEMFGNPMNNPKNWDLRKFGSVGTLDRGMSKHRPRNAPELLGGDHPLIQTGDVSNSGIYIHTYKSTYSDIGLKQSKKWPKGTLCITIAANIAKTGILNFDACFPDSVVGFVPDERQTNNLFIHYWISFLQEMLERNAPVSAQKNINLKILRDLDVFMPPIESQNKFADIVKRTELIRQNMLAQATDLDSQFHSLMQRAFN